MQLKGTIHQITPTETVGQNGTQKRQVVLNTGDQYNTYVAITFMGKQFDKSNNLSEGQTVSIEVNISSREYNGRWYTEVSGWKVENNTVELP
jgi:predicted adenine nucleotide alpha hydrolase (AANH) superfamily ATPase